MLRRNLRRCRGFSHEVAGHWHNWQPIPDKLLDVLKRLHDPPTVAASAGELLREMMPAIRSSLTAFGPYHLG
jgi:hypothetical protein